MTRIANTFKCMGFTPPSLALLVLQLQESRHMVLLLRRTTPRLPND